MKHMCFVHHPINYNIDLKPIFAFSFSSHNTVGVLTLFGLQLMDRCSCYLNTQISQHFILGIINIKLSFIYCFFRLLVTTLNMYLCIILTKHSQSKKNYLYKNIIVLNSTTFYNYLIGIYLKHIYFIEIVSYFIKITLISQL